MNAYLFLKHVHNRKALIKLSMELINQFNEYCEQFDCQTFIDSGWRDINNVLLYAYRQNQCRDVVTVWYKLNTVHGTNLECYSTCDSATLPKNWSKIDSYTSIHGDFSVYFKWQQDKELDVASKKRKRSSDVQASVKKHCQYSESDGATASTLYVPYCQVLKM